MSETVYEHFKETLIDAIKSTEISTFEKAWKSVSAKTEFYNDFFQKIASTMKCELVYEDLRCDYTLTDSNDFPLVRIESENAHTTASHEVRKLCQLLCPVKALFISCDWADSEKEKWLPIWQSEIKKFNLFYPTDFKFCLVIGEWGRGNPSDDILRYYIITLSSDGEIFEEDNNGSGTFVVEVAKGR